jgi:hypothetical protein
MNFTLQDFTRFFLAHPFDRLRMLEFYDFTSVLSQIVYREGRFQAELFMLRPNIGFPRQHRHPDVDSIDVGMSYQVPLIVGGLDLSGGRPNFGAHYHIGPEDWHTVGDVPNGGAFVSLQEWLHDIPPTSVGLNWEGTPVSEAHRALLRRPDAKWIKTIRKEF